MKAVFAAVCLLAFLHFISIDAQVIKSSSNLESNGQELIPTVTSFIQRNENLRTVRQINNNAGGARLRSRSTNGQRRRFFPKGVISG
ncbi:hypothetical protein Bhyg_05702 [Pseudolycoriella hygida]|uniref:Uncharacterized protein n=1 Tax=Pseudolycoriella hygida TaxID=35572 RepID=A0A9Q0S285_9DIPT|nr:hypothetical protein Bhyg_05702 [Pseudolycoriella hygida]